MDDAVRRYVERLDRARERPLAEQLEEELAPLRGLSMSERARIIKSVCSAAARIIESRPDRERVLAWHDPLPPESEALWRNLVQRTAKERSSHGRT